MSEEPRLPEDLMAFEARLAARSLPPVGLERDDVLYAAGWAAATAAARPRRYKDVAARIAWPACSAVAAAVLAVMATLQWTDRHDTIAKAVPSTTTREAVDDVAVRRVPKSPSPATLKAPRNELNRLARIRANTNLLTLRDQMLQGTNWISWQDDAQSTGSATSASPSKTARELLLEFLPEGTSDLYEG